MERFVATLPKEGYGKPVAMLRGFDIGGGTPTTLSHKALEKLLVIMNRSVEQFNLGENFLASIEGSFSSIDKDKIAIIGELGRHISRISFGLQNINPLWLKAQNRSSSPVNHIITTIEECRKAGIRILNLDLMYGFLRQGRDSFDATLKLVEKVGPEHLTLYQLRTNMLQDKRSSNAQECFEQYSYLYNKILSMGYSGRMSCNTFSLIGDDGVSSYLSNRMVHGGAYKGFGIAAQSKARDGICYNIGKRTQTIALEKCLANGTFETEGDIYRLPPIEMAAKYIAICGYCGQFSLSKLKSILSCGTTFDQISKDQQGCELSCKNRSDHYQIVLNCYNEELKFLVDNGYLEIEGDIATITPKGFRHYGAVLSIFYPEKD